MQAASKNPLSKFQSLVANDRVRSELGIKKEQMQSFKDSFGSLRDKYKGQISELQQKPPKEIKELRPKLFQDIEVEAEEVVGSILGPQQLERFKQLRLQSQGITAFADKHLRDELDFTQDQLMKLKNIAQSGPDTEGGAGEADAVGKVLAMLSQDQLAKWNALRGREFDFGATPGADSAANEYQEGDEEQEAHHDFDLEMLQPLDEQQQYFVIKFLFRGESKYYEAPPLRCFQNDDLQTAQDRLVQVLKHFIDSNCPDGERHSPETYREMLQRVSEADSTGKSAEASYSSYVQLFPDTWWTFMNFGYNDPFDQPNDSKWTEAEKLWRNPVQLYLQTLGQVKVTGRDVLEVGCGRGGGSAFIARHLKPKSVTATDAAGSNVLFCQSAHKVKGVQYCYGTAFKMPRPDESADIVLSIESFNYYKPLSSFMVEAARVLRTGGNLLVTGWGPPKLLEKLVDTAEAHGLSLISSKNLTNGACQSIQDFDPVAIVADRKTVRPKWLYVDMWRRVRSDLSTIQSGATPYFTFAFEKTA
jgi:ubiquinone/menaquinone biosynthesis C-methylase UbiE